jgi:hypothetical protein
VQAVTVIGWSCGRTLTLYGMLVHVISVHLTGPLFASVKIDFGRVTEEASTSGCFFKWAITSLYVGSFL